MLANTLVLSGSGFTVSVTYSNPRLDHLSGVWPDQLAHGDELVESATAQLPT